MEGWWVASKRLAALPRRRGSALADGCGRGGRVVLPLARAAAVWTGLREQVVLGERLEFDSDGQPPLVRVRVSYSA